MRKAYLIILTVFLLAGTVWAGEDATVDQDFQKKVWDGANIYLNNTKLMEKFAPNDRFAEYTVCQTLDETLTRQSGPLSSVFMAEMGGKTGITYSQLCQSWNTLRQGITNAESARKLIHVIMQDRAIVVIKRNPTNNPNETKEVVFKRLLDMEAIMTTHDLGAVKSLDSEWLFARLLGGFGAPETDDFSRLVSALVTFNYKTAMQIVESQDSPAIKQYASALLSK